MSSWNSVCVSKIEHLLVALTQPTLCIGDLPNAVMEPSEVQSDIAGLNWTRLENFRNLKETQLFIGN